MTEHTPVTFIRINRDTEATRSPVDGIWRVWSRLGLDRVEGWGPNEYEEADILRSDGTRFNIPKAWVVTGTGRKVKEALDMSRQALGAAQLSSAA